MNDALARWAAERSAVDLSLERISDKADSTLGTDLGSAVRYALTGGGKRLRALLVIAGHRAVGGSQNVADLAAAVEVIHAYSLVHDDLPAMDDDDLRRGRPTAHRVFGVPIATCAGVAMVPLAAWIAADALEELRVPTPTIRRILGVLMSASGAGCMIGGQLMDLEAEGRSLELPEMENVHRAKTGALIRASVLVGGLSAGASGRRFDALEQYGQALGLAFQIADDVLDVTATSATLGKVTGRDADLGKSTYPALLGLEAARARAGALIGEAIGAASGEDIQSDDLISLAQFVGARI